MKDKFNAFFSKWNGKPCEVNDPSNLNQCMDLAYAWLDSIGVTRDAIRHLYAYEVYTKPNDLTVKYFELVPNTALAIPKIGDLVVFKGGVAGHISISNGVGDTNTFQTFDQNFGTTVNKAGLITHVYDNVLGFLRFRVAPAPEINELTLLPIIDTQGHDMTVQEVRSKLAEQDRIIISQLNEKEQWLKERDGYFAQIDDLKRKNETQTIMLVTLNAKITELENKPNEYRLIIQQIHNILYNTGWWWIKWAKIKALVPQ